MSLYNIKRSDDHFLITKFDDDLNVESSYEFHNHPVQGYLCHCPAGQRPTCRHRQMFPMLSLRVDSPWFLDFDTRKWVDPTGAASEASSLVEVCQTCHGNKTIYPKLDSGRIAYTAAPCPDCSGSQGSLDLDASKFTGFEEQSAPEPTVSSPDTHPFRRRM